MEGSSTLSSLLRILASNIETLEAAYDKQGAPFPSLDAPFAPSPLAQDPELVKCTRVAVGAAFQIVATVRDPVEALQDAAMASYGPAALNVAVDLHIANILSESSSDGLHIDEIAKQTGRPGDAIARSLRYLATRHIFREIEPDTFANNRISSLLIKRHSVAEIKADPTIEYDGSPGAAFVGHATDEGMKGAAAIGAWVTSKYQNYSSPFNYGNNVEHDVFRWYATDPFRNRRFHAFMAGYAKLWPAAIFTESLDWKSLSQDSVVVDVGGSVGQATLTLIDAFPHLKYVVQDLDVVIKHDALKHWESERPSALSDGRVTLQAINFFASQPVSGAAVYFLRMVVHDWTDSRAKQILQIIRKAAAPSSKLVLFDMIMPYACDYTGPFAEVATPIKAPSPLLANLGLGYGALITAVDMQMLNFFNGKERTVAQFAELGKQSGWKLESVRPTTPMASLVFSAE